MQLFVVKGRRSPRCAGHSILPGITRKSIIDMARAKGFEVEERDVSVEGGARGGRVLLHRHRGGGGARRKRHPPRERSACSRRAGSDPWASRCTTTSPACVGVPQDTMGWLEKVPEGFHL